MRRWVVAFAFWAGLYWYVLAVTRDVVHDASFTDPQVWVPGLLGIAGLSIWKVWNDV